MTVNKTVLFSLAIICITSLDITVMVVFQVNGTVMLIIALIIGALATGSFDKLLTYIISKDLFDKSGFKPLPPYSSPLV